MPVSMSAMAVTMAMPSLAAVLPKMSFMAWPTACEFCGSSPSFCATICTASNIVVCPETRSSSNCFDEMPMLSRAVAVDLLIVRIFCSAIWIIAIPPSLKTPERVCTIIDTSSWTELPASLAAGPYCCICCSRVPLRSPPACRPSLMTLMASSAVMPKWPIMLSTVPRTSL